MQFSSTALLLAAIALCFFNCIANAIAASSHPIESSGVPSFDWTAIEAAPDLLWHDCYSLPSTQDSTQRPIFSSPKRQISCALLSLPLDYHNSTNLHNVSVPVLKASSPPSPSHRATIFISFGGAGNSRIQDFVNSFLATGFLAFFDPELEYDFVTFDNRGFGHSSPSARCFDEVLDGALWEDRMADLGGVMSTAEGDVGLGVRLAAAKARGELCAQRDVKDGHIRQHMTTAYAARDMLEILKRLGNGSSPSSRTQFNDENATKLQFIGLSYGTVLGQTFASLYPEYVSRMILDGVASASDWTGKWQMRHLIDTDAVWESFYQDCFEAKEGCPLWRSTDSRQADIEKRVSGFVESLKTRPAYTVSDGNARLITYRDAKLAIYWATMAPFTFFDMAATMDGLMRGYINLTIEFPFNKLPSALDCADNQESRAGSNSDAGTALNCADEEDITNSTLEEFNEYLSALEEQSSEAAFFQAERKIRCMGWPIRPAWRFTGPFTSKMENGSSKLEIPILFMGNRLDPMTSLSNAWEVAEDYPGSVVLEQNSIGHCVLGGFPNSCTLGYVRDYLRDGSLPENGTVCGDHCNMFDGSCFNGEDFSAVWTL